MIVTLKNCIIYVLNQLTVKTLFPNGCSNFVWPYTAWGHLTLWIKWSLSWNIRRLYVRPSSKIWVWKMQMSFIDIEMNMKWRLILTDDQSLRNIYVYANIVMYLCHVHLYFHIYSYTNMQIWVSFYVYFSGLCLFVTHGNLSSVDGRYCRTTAKIATN